MASFAVTLVYAINAVIYVMLIERRRANGQTHQFTPDAAPDG